MQVPFYLKKSAPFIFIFLFLTLEMDAQPITGVWNGKMGSSKVELKLVRKGDSLIGTSYYYDTKTNYRRYSVKGYFDDRNNDVIWWDDILLEDNASRRFNATGPVALLAVADFNCPGEGIMKLDGSSSKKDDQEKDKKELHLVKGSTAPEFPDEWDFLIENYAYSVVHPEIVDSIEEMAFVRVPAPDPVETTGKTAATAKFPVMAEPEENSRESNTIAGKTAPEIKQEPIHAPVYLPPSEQTNEERFTSRKKILQNVIPVKGDSIELRFYDNAEIDGDSIAVFLNGRLLREHILLAEQAYIMKIAVSDLQPDNELVMVAENLGTIPPNTSLMVAIVEDKRYEAHLQSTEGSSALVRLVKP